MAVPKLILHPGLPKCATSALQALFVRNDYSLSHTCSVIPLGKKFLPFNGYPPVTEIMYSPNTAISQIQSVEISGGTCFLSSEALLGKPKIIECLKEYFDLSRIILTVRFPPFQAFSNYCYSGWLSHSVSDILDQGNIVVGLSAAFQRHASVFKRMSGFALTVACPIEGAHSSLLPRFCKAAFGYNLSSNDQNMLHASIIRNRSISIGFASALHEVILQLNLGITPYDRAKYAKAMQSYQLPKPIENLFPPNCKGLFLARFKEAIDSYEHQLIVWGASSRDARLGVISVTSKLEELGDVSEASHSEYSELIAHAYAAIDGVSTQMR